MRLICDYWVLEDLCTRSELKGFAALKAADKEALQKLLGTQTKVLSGLETAKATYPCFFISVPIV